VRVFALSCFVACLLWACNPDAPGPGAETACGTLFPGLRIDTACGLGLRVVLDGRDIPPTPRRIDLADAVILPWPDWAREGMPSFAEAGGARIEFTAHPYMCQELTLSCATSAPDGSTAP
jgi:hypothetical protein